MQPRAAQCVVFLTHCRENAGLRPGVRNKKGASP
jgi:hypothetical protein